MNSFTLSKFSIKIKLILVLLAILLPHHVNADTNLLDPVDQSLEDIKPPCEQSGLKEYFDCIEIYKAKLLQKRDTITHSEFEACKVARKKCLETCSQNMKRNIQCNVEKCPICPTVQLIDGIKSTIVEGESGAYKYQMPILPRQNITTIIKLTNLINNTNVVDIPTNINSTNVNNIFIYNNETSKTGGDFGLGYNKIGSCCLAIQPKTCRATSAGPRCHHKRHKTCGPQCISRVIHAQSRQRCTRDHGCKNRIGYVPQPRQPRCVHTAEWPYASCGGRYQRSCDGCYDHYGYGASNFYNGGRHPRHCTGCYDDGFDMSPLYRRGPVFQPFYYHQIPCYLTGTCGMPMCNFYGCFGHEYIDPAFGQTGYADDGYPSDYGNDLEFINELEKTGNNDTNILDPEINSSWGVEVYKCKVVGNDGAIEIRNCTDDELDKNPFASSPSEYPYYPPQANESPDYLLENPYYSPKRTSPGKHHSPNGRQDFIYEDYATEDEVNDRSRRRASLYQHKNDHNRRRVQIVYDDDNND